MPLPSGRHTAVLLTLLAGCTPSPNAIPPVVNAASPHVMANSWDQEFALSKDVREYSRELPVSIDSATTLVLAHYQNIGIATAVLSRDPRVIGNEHVAMRRTLNGRFLATFLDCGVTPSGVLANTYRIQASVLTAVVPGKNGGSVIETRMTANGMSNEGASGGSVDCSSKGVLERELLAALAK